MKEKREELIRQQEMAKELFIKCQGAIELLDGMIKEEEDKKNGKEKDNKKV
jgi:hypothetical protein